MTTPIMFHGPGHECGWCHVEVGGHHDQGCPGEGAPPGGSPRRRMNPLTLFIKLFDECARLEAYEREVRKAVDAFRSTSAVMLVQSQVRVVCSTYRALVASGALPEAGTGPVGPVTVPSFPPVGANGPGAPSGATRLEYVDPDEDQAAARLVSTHIDCGALKAAAATLHAHRQLIIASNSDLYQRDGTLSSISYSTDALHDVIAAIRHVVEDDFRSRETRGGS